jgi:hypothetical protein
MDKMKSKITNPVLKENFSLQGFANYVASTMSGNQIINNLDVKENTNTKNLRVINRIEAKNINSREINIDDSIKLRSEEIIVSPNTLLKMKDSQLVLFSLIKDF